jgi:autotransporter-associated beta strand protein
MAVAAVGVQAASDSWKMDTAGNWDLGSNWTSGSAPGYASGFGDSNSTDVATFAGTLTTLRTVTVDANRNIGGITISNNPSANRYTLQSGSLLLSNGGKILEDGANGAHTDVISTPITIMGNSGSATFANNATLSTCVLSLTGAISGNATAGNVTTLTLNGTNTGLNVLSTSAVSDGANGGKLAIVKNDTGQWRLLGNNTFSGGVTLNTGSFGLGSFANCLGTGTFTINGGQITQLNAVGPFTNTVVVGGDFTIADGFNRFDLSGPVDFGAVTRTLTVNTWGTISGPISGAAGVGLIKSGAGTNTLSGVNSFSGDISVNAGTLSVNTISNSGLACAIGAGSVIKLGATTVAGTLVYTGTGDRTDRTVDLAGTTGYATINNNGTGALVFTGLITASGVGAKQFVLGGTNASITNEIQGNIPDSNPGVSKTSLTKNGSGTWTLSGSNTFSSTTAISDGILRLGSKFAIPGAIGINKGTLDLNGKTNALSGTGTLALGAATTTVSNNTANIVDSVGGGSLIMGADLTYNAGSATFNNGQSTISANLGLGGSNRSFFIGDSDQTTEEVVISGVISDLTKSIIKQGAGVLVLSGNNVYAGPTYIRLGTLKLGANDVLPDGSPVTFQSRIGTMATLDVAGRTDAITSINLSETVGQTVPGSQSRIIDSVGGGRLKLGGNAAYNAGAAATNNGQSFISASLDLNGATRTFTIADSDQTTQETVISGGITNSTGTAGLTKSGVGVLILAGTNTYNGDTTISASSPLLLGADNAIPNGSGKGNVSVTGTLDLNGHSETINGLSGAGTITNGIAGTQTLTVGDNDQSSAFTGKIQAGIGNVAIAKIGSGTVQLSGTCTYNGGLTINAGAIASANSGVGFGTITLNGGALASVNNGGRTWTNAIVVGGDFTLGQAVTYTGALILSGPMDLSGGIRTITVANSPVAGDTLSGVISNGGIIKAGPGLLNLSGTNTYSGATSVSDGVLCLTHAQVLSATNDVYIATGALLKLAFSGTLTIGNLYVNGERMTVNRVYGSDKTFIDPSSTGYLFTADGAKPKGTLIRVF